MPADDSTQIDACQCTSSPFMMSTTPLPSILQKVLRSASMHGPADHTVVHADGSASDIPVGHHLQLASAMAAAHWAHSLFRCRVLVTASHQAKCAM